MTMPAAPSNTALYTAVALAKTDRVTGATRGVIGHCLDVAHCAFAMLTTGVLHERLHALAGYPLTNVDVARLAVLAGVHDLGKCCVGFQNRIHGLNPESGHVAEAIAAMAREPRVRTALGPIPSWCARPAEMLHAVIAHHGEPVAHDRITACIGDLGWQWRCAANGYDPIAEMHALLAALLTAFPEATQPAAAFPASAAFEHAVAGLVMTADWMGSDTQWHPLSGPDDRPEQAHALLAATMWAGWTAQGSGDVLGSRAPRPLQQVLMTHPLDHLVIAEAPTGEGKTEAALVWASRLVCAGLVDGLYFAVPTRSAATELHDRVARSLGHAYPLLRGHTVRAVPGLVSTDPRDPTLPPTWALGSMRRVMGAPVVVGTVDQAMLSVLRVRHAWLRSWCLSRHLLVIDEAHASDAYMTTIITALVDTHLAAGGYALLMSATLGETMAARLTRRSRLPVGTAVQRPYPLVSSGTVSVPVASSRRKSVRPTIASLSACEAQATARAQQGEAVLWIRSTVADAVDDVRRLRAAGVPTILHHSRYADADRRHLDAQVLGVIGIAGQRRGVVIVATQTCEQSLDIDADLLVTDACPADVMLQRMGRVGRHRPGLIPKVWVVDPAPSAVSWSRYLQRSGERHGVAGQGWGWVYDPLPVRATLDWLRGRALVTVPDDARNWVESATHADGLLTVAQAYGSDWVAAWQAAYGRDSASRARADAGLIDRTCGYHLALVDERIPTRLGDPSVDVPVNGLVSPFGQGAIDVLPVPGRWLLGAGVGPQAAASVEGLDALGRAAIVVRDGGVLRVVYGADGLHRG
jgi:CRISPR-associated endonuclease/helicase Cas3